jgi:hypothetical protein
MHICKGHEHSSSAPARRYNMGDGDLKFAWKDGSNAYWATMIIYNVPNGISKARSPFAALHWDGASRCVCTEWTTRGCHAPPHCLSACRVCQCGSAACERVSRQKPQRSVAAALQVEQKTSKGWTKLESLGPLAQQMQLAERGDGNTYTVRVRAHCV